MALKFGVCSVTFLIRNWPNFNIVKKIHDLLGARQHSKKRSEKEKPSSLIVMILQYTKNLWLNSFYNSMT